MCSDNNESISNLKQQGRNLMRGNRLVDAKAVFSRVCILEPTDAESWFALGMINGQLNMLAEAVIGFRNALALESNRPEIHYNLGKTLQAQGYDEQALQSYREAVRLKPDFAAAYSNMGTLLQMQGRLDEALDCHREALRAEPLAEVHFNLGNVYKGLGRYQEAESSYRSALRLKPNAVQAISNLGRVLHLTNQLSEALVCYRAALQLAPSHDVYNNMGNVLKDLGHYQEAGSCYRSALQLKPNFAEAHNNLGIILSLTNRLDEALTHYRESLQLVPLPGTYLNMGNALRDMERYEEAEASYRTALQLNPNLAEAHNNLGNMLRQATLLDEALTSYREALRLDPGNAQFHSNYLLALTYREDYDAAMLFSEHVRWGELHGRVHSETAAHNNPPDPNKRLRIGYVSGDFRKHPIAIFIEQILAHHDKNRCEIFCYSNCPINDDVTKRLHSHADYWRNAFGQSDEHLACQIRQDGIDILVDLSGHTAANRLPAFALKPAPVQATWVGYVATTGLPAMDYIISDRFLIPPEEEGYYVEQAARLPHAYLCFSPPEDPITPSPLPALSTGKITFGCFNNSTKVTEAVIACWSRLLHALPEAQLYLKFKPYGDAEVQHRYQALFARHGIGPGRIKFSGHSSRDKLLAAYHEVDIALDPYPYNGGTTTVEALWMGVPVVTRRGSRFSSHVGETILNNIGLQECVADNEEAYITKAIKMASNLPRLAAMRASLRQQLLNSPLCDGPGFTRDLETTYRAMWERWCGAQLSTS